MKFIDIFDLSKYLKRTGDNQTARIGHVNAVIEQVNSLGNVDAQGDFGLEGTQYLFVSANGTDVENATELQAAYDTAKTMSPSATNRITVIAAPGTYKFPSTFVMDTEFIDLVSLTGNRDVVFDIDVVDPFQYDDDTFDIISIGECLLIDTDNVFVKGIKGKFYLSPNWDEYYFNADGENEDYILPIQVSDDLPNISVENCEGGIYSFGSDITFGLNPIEVSGTFIKCIGGLGSFGGINSGIFNNCVGGDESFGSGILSGIFTNCSGGDYSFSSPIVSGTFTDCQGGNDSFGDNASGTFNNCVGGNFSFASGVGSTASGIFTNCQSGIQSFGGSGDASGTFTNCIGGNSSFGSGTLTGQLYNCRLTSGTFQTVSGGGVTVLCIDGNNQVNTQN